MKIYHFLSVMLALCLSLYVTRAQGTGQQLSPEEKEKQLLEYVDKEIQRLSNLLDLEYWQEFYIDSTLTHDIKAMTEEMESLQAAKVENADLYMNVQDKWLQQIDNTYKRLFTADQWNKYWKSGGKRAQDARDKRNKKRKSE